MTTLKVAIITANVAARYGGPAFAEPAYAEALARVGVDVRLFTTTQNGRDRLGVPTKSAMKTGSYETWYFHPGPATSRPWAPGWAAGIRAAVRWADIVKVNSLYLPQNLYTYTASMIYDTPYVVRPHGTLEPYQRQTRPLVKWAYDLAFGGRYLHDAAGFHFTTESEAEGAADLVGTERAFVAPVPVAPAQVPTPVAANTRVLFLGRVTSKKRIDLLLDCWPAVLSEVPEARLTIAGPIDSDQRVWIARRNSDPSIEFVGIVNGELKERLLTSSAVFVLPSENENFGVAVTEAMAFGIPVVVSNRVALHDLVAEANAGRVISSLDPSHLASAILDLLSSPSIRTTCGENARRLVQRHFDQERIGTALKDWLSGLADRRR